MDKELLSKVTFFLNNFIKCAEQGLVEYRDLKPKTTNFLRSIGWIYKAMENHILNNIKPENYFRGPTKHHHRKECTVMEFGMILEDADSLSLFKLYVKLELIVSNDSLIAGYMSFHPREQEIEHFPLDEKNEVI